MATRALFKDGAIVNLIEIEETCVAITQAEASAMPFEELSIGSFYILSDGHTIGDVAE